MKPKPFHCPTLLVVAQRPFQTDSGEFCKLAPLIYLDGDYTRKEEFLNDGEVWWMLTPRTRGFAEPGRVVVAQLERAIRFDETDPEKSGVQAEINSIRDPGKDDVFQVIRVADGDASTPQDLVESFRMAPGTRHLGHVFVHWRSNYYGPFRALEDALSTASPNRYRLAPQDTIKNRVFAIAAQQFEASVSIEKCDEDISLSTQPRRVARGAEKAPLRFEYFLASCLPSVLKSAEPHPLILEPISAKLRRAANSCLLRKEAQQFRGLLENLEQRAIDQQATTDLVEAVRSRRSFVEADLEALDSLALSMLESGLLGPERLERIEGQIAEKYLAQHGSTLRAKLDADLDLTRRELEELKRERSHVEAEIKKTQERDREQFQQRLSTERAAMLKAVDSEREKLQADRAEVERQQAVLKNNLIEVTRDLSEAGDKVINQFLAIEPLLGRVAPGRSTDSVAVQRPDKSALPRFEPLIRSRPAEAAEPVAEAVFVDRVLRLASEKGVRFRRGDVERFHLSIKSGEITVLCGPSGTGKSSLAMVYGEALRGSEAGEHQSHIVIPVSPTWMDASDLLGHVSATERHFIPSESGLYEFLLNSQAEHAGLGEHSSVALAILDEMNLSQVEHYFGDLMLALERRGADRSIRCFAKAATLPSCPFHEHGRVRLSDSLRIVGTMNFDETVRQLSDRFLDRANLIYLSAGTVGADAPAISPSDCGRTITRRDFIEWSASRPLEEDKAKFIDDLYRLMDDLGHSVSPRVRDDLYRYICNSGGLITQAQATDYQLAQRVLSKVRMIRGRRQQDAFERLQRHIDAGARDFGLQETMTAMHRLRASLTEDSLYDE